MNKNNRDFIRIRGAKEHNLKNIDIDIPRDKFVVVTGLSGSGKSSLAFDTIYAEGQRRYVESLSAYARQFLGQMEKPSVESIEGLSPAISIDQKTTNRNPRSTVGTVTEIYDYFRLLYARSGTAHCPVCNRVIDKQSVDEIVDKVLELEDRTKIMVIAPVIRGEKGTHKKLIEYLEKEGFVRIRVDGEMYEVSDNIKLEKNKKHTIDIVIDRLVIKDGIRKRLTDSIETALNHTEGLVIISNLDGDEVLYSTNFSCPEHGAGISEMEPRMFSFNAPYGACDKCKGIGYKLKVDEKLVVPDENLSFTGGCIAPYASSAEGTYYYEMLYAVINSYDVLKTTAYKDYPDELKTDLLYGTGKRKIKFKYGSLFDKGKRTYSGTFEGIVKNLERRHKETISDQMRTSIENYMRLTPCEKCGGSKLKDEVLAVKVGSKNISELTDLSIKDCKKFISELELFGSKKMIAEEILKEISARLKFLSDVGLDYLSLSRAAGSLSGGESQRIRLATQIGAGLCGVLYILDEPSIGLHQKDNERLLKTLRNLTDIGNSLIVVEHDEDTIRACDHVIDIGPGAGIHGGYIVGQGSVEDLIKSKDSLTGKYLSGERMIPVPRKRRKSTGHLRVLEASENNLKNVTVDFPLGVITAVTGVSGSGKSSLVNEVLYKTLVKNTRKSSKVVPGKSKGILGYEDIDKIIDIDQSPIGRTPRSNPATYTKVFDDIRDIFAMTKEAKARGYDKGRFSFNVKKGRCESCSGDGIIKIEMHFLPDVYVPCDVCKGKRYNKETLEVKYKGKSISDILDMTVEEAFHFFENIPKIKNKLQTLMDVGLEYIHLGQPSTQLSGGEAQRIKLSSELSKRSTGKTIYILDEPTTGLHMADVHKLIEVLNRLADSGNTVVVIEHNLDVIKSADYIIDIGRDGGDGGGEVVAQGTPEELVLKYIDTSYTAEFLEKIL